MADSPNISNMALHAQIEAVVERTERLLLRYEELERTNVLMQEQLDAVCQERDTLKLRLSAARTRIDALIERLPEQSTSSSEAG